MFLTQVDPGDFGFESVIDVVQFNAQFSDNFKQLALVIRQQVYNISQELPAMISKIVPVALPVLGIVIAVFFGVKFIKKTMR